MGRHTPAVQMSWHALTAGLLSGIIASMGLGGGTVLLIYLTVFLSTEQLTAQGINLMFFIPIGVLSVIIYAKKKRIQFKKVVPIAVFGVAGSFLGLLITHIIERGMLCKISALFLIALGISEFITKDKSGIEKNAQK